MPLPIANAQMVDFVDLLMIIINKSSDIGSEEEHRYKICAVCQSCFSCEVRRDDPKLYHTIRKIKILKFVGGEGDIHNIYI